MKIKDLIATLQTIDPEGLVCVVDHDQNTQWAITEIRTCEDASSEFYKSYADIVIDYHEDFI